jgi:GT2 family glycosyltransferase
MSCDIIIPVWNEPVHTKRCIESIVSRTRFPYRLIMVDNASGPDTAGYLRETAAATGAVYIRNTRNEGFVRAANRGLERSDAPYACIMNNDTIATEGWLTEMVKVAGLDEAIGIVNPSSNNLGQHTGRLTPEEYAGTIRRLSGQFIEMGACLGFCMLIKRELLGKIGRFDEIYERGNFEETDYCRRAEREGYYCVRAKGAYVYHHMKTSFVKFGDYEESFRRNREIFNRRWGRPRRVLYIVTRRSDKLFDRMGREALRSARGGNWVWFFCKKGGERPAVREHSNIRFISVPEAFFGWNCLVRILKKKKRFDSIYADDPRLAQRIKSYGRFHGAETKLMGG